MSKANLMWYKTSPLWPTPQGWKVFKLKNILTEGKLWGNYENTENITWIPVMKMGNIWRGKIQLSKVDYLPKERLYNKEDVLKKGDLLFNTRNTLDLVGKVAIRDEELPFALYNSNLYRMKFDTWYVDSNYFMNYLFNSNKVLTQLRGFATGTTSVAAIYWRDLEKTKVALPPIPEQQSITIILKTIDDTIILTEQIIKKLALRNKWLQQKLLTGKIRIKGFTEKFKRLSADHIFKYISIKNLPNETLLSATQDRWIIPRDMLESRVTMPTTEANSYKLVNPWNFIISLRSFQWWLEYSNYRWIVSPAYTVLENIIPINDDFYKYYFKSYDFIWHLAVAVIGIRDWKQISFDNFCVLDLPYPQIDEQKAIANILNKAAEEIELYKHKLESMKEIKKWLMQQLLTGKVRTNMK